MLRLALELLGDLVAPFRCAGCDGPVRRRVLMCPPCAATVTRAAARPLPEAAFVYGGAVATAIVRLKYAGRSDLAERLGVVLAQAAAPYAGLVDVVVPVPLHPRRVVSRGYDQVLLLARPVAAALERPLLHALRRVRDTPKQASLPDRAWRLRNVHHAFVCPSPASVAGRRILLVDDVRTTGATLAASARALHAAGAGLVHAVALASRQDDVRGGDDG